MPRLPNLSEGVQRNSYSYSYRARGKMYPSQSSAAIQRCLPSTRAGLGFTTPTAKGCGQWTCSAKCTDGTCCQWTCTI